MADVRLYLKKLSTHLFETCPDVTPEAAKKVINSYRQYMWNLRQERNYCDVCYNLITEKEAAKTGHTDFMYCCDKHGEFRTAFQVERVRKEIGLTVEDLPQLDIYG